MKLQRYRVKGTYGGWRLGGKIRKMENFDDAPSAPDNSYDRFAWKQAWTDFQKKAFRLQQNNKYRFFIVFDIANFYDSIRLRRLEVIIREAMGVNKTPVVNLLFYFLSNWGKRDLNYERQNIGLPQDEVGDCSRILANFYLQAYDRIISQAALERKSAYLRFADDQIIASPDEKTAKEIMFIASKELAKLGLNLNAGKAKLLNKQSFSEYWSFDIFTLLQDQNNSKNIQKGWEIYKKRVTDQKVDFRPEAVLRRLLGCNLNKLRKETREAILAAATQKSFITNAKDYYLSRIYTFTDRRNKHKLLKQLNNLSEEVLFNQFHYRILKFARTSGVNLRHLDKVKPSLIKLKNLIQ